MAIFDTIGIDETYDNIWNQHNLTNKFIKSQTRRERTVRKKNLDRKKELIGILTVFIYLNIHN